MMRGFMELLCPEAFGKAAVQTTKYSKKPKIIIINFK
jgi:hypothetical protein